MSDDPWIDPRIAKLVPDFRAISLFVDAPEGATATIEDPLATACERVLNGAPAWADAHLAKWYEAYLQFGAKPNRTPNSAQALRKRVLKDGMIPSINPVVDLYNAVSLSYAVPVGGENFDAYVGRPRLTLADGTEVFDTSVNGEPVAEQPTPGEVIWRDDVGVTCRRWNWRQGTRTRLDRPSGRMWFVLEALGTMPDSALQEAADELSVGLARLMPDCIITMRETSVAA